MMTVGLAVLPTATTAVQLAISAGLFAIGFGSSYPVFAAYVMQDIGESATRGRLWRDPRGV